MYTNSIQSLIPVRRRVSQFRIENSLIADIVLELMNKDT